MISNVTSVFDCCGEVDVVMFRLASSLFDAQKEAKFSFDSNNLYKVGGLGSNQAELSK